jgi:hypothetical protein
MAVLTKTHSLDDSLYQCCSYPTRMAQTTHPKANFEQPTGRKESEQRLEAWLSQD